MVGGGRNRTALHDAVVVGAGPNGLAAAVTLARAGASVLVLEAADTVGGGTRSAELTQEGFVHDVCSAIHPLAASSPFFAPLPLADHGLEWVHSDAPLAHPMPDGTVVVVERSLPATASALGSDARAWRRLLGPLVRRWEPLCDSILAPLVRPPAHPLVMSRFGTRALWPATTLARRVFRHEAARAVFAGMAAHSFLDLGRPLTSSFGLTLAASAHAVGWPVARGGSQRIADALVSYLRSLGGEVETGCAVTSVEELPAHRVALFDVTPRQLLAICGDRLDPRYRRQLGRYRYGPGAFKIDYALDAPVPWTAEGSGRAATVHLGGGLDEIALAEREVAAGRHPERPFVLGAQPSLFDPSRAPAGRHTFWAYCHVPHASALDMTAAIEAQIERFAPGFRERVVARHVMGTAELERHNANYVGGDIAGGSHGGRQLLLRPVTRLDPYRVVTEGPEHWFLCSASTPPGAGVHGMCGLWAARAALRHL